GRGAPRRPGHEPPLFCLDAAAHQQPAGPVDGQVKEGGDNERVAVREVHARVGSLAWEGTGRWFSSQASVTSRQTFFCRRQDSVSVEAKVPFSKNLLAGALPPQNAK